MGLGFALRDPQTAFESTVPPLGFAASLFGFLLLAAQVRQLVSLIAYQQRVDAAVMLFKRTVDQQNFAEQVYRLLKPSAQPAALRRLEHERVATDN